jgi:hypothetical protein
MLTALSLSFSSSLWQQSQIQPPEQLFAPGLHLQEELAAVNGPDQADACVNEQLEKGENLFDRCKGRVEGTGEGGGENDTEVGAGNGACNAEESVILVMEDSGLKTQQEPREAATETLEQQAREERACGRCPVQLQRPGSAGAARCSCSICNLRGVFEIAPPVSETLDLESGIIRIRRSVSWPRDLPEQSMSPRRKHRLGGAGNNPQEDTSFERAATQARKENGGLYDFWSFKPIPMEDILEDGIPPYQRAHRQLNAVLRITVLEGSNFPRVYGDGDFGFDYLPRSGFSTGISVSITFHDQVSFNTCAFFSECVRARSCTTCIRVPTLTRHSSVVPVCLSGARNSDRTRRPELQVGGRAKIFRA